ncbi:hypothetical protein H8E88_26540 [candidate division KSB1 bacterium]|nr:hypothetical protein [candidate division KSB1 bacterium]MBL7095765.1 hypothetical protein [candidate division KSB1 bacterium]
MSKKNKKQNPKKRKRIAVVDGTSIPNQLRKARSYPVKECYITEGWQEGGIGNIYILREKPNGNFVMGVFLIDIFCLGLKNTFYNPDISSAEIKDMINNKPDEKQIEIDIDDAHSIIYGGIDYAENLGFKPHSDFKVTKFILSPWEEIEFDDTIEFGKDGKPFYFAGPYDSQEKISRIIRHLEESVGKDNFTFAIPGDDLIYQS